MQEKFPGTANFLCRRGAWSPARRRRRAAIDSAANAPYTALLCHKL
jgi:hypothetical protein